MQKCPTGLDVNGPVVFYAPTPTSELLVKHVHCGKIPNKSIGHCERQQVGFEGGIQEGHQSFLSCLLLCASARTNGLENRSARWVVGECGGKVSITDVCAAAGKQILVNLPCPSKASHSWSLVTSPTVTQVPATDKTELLLRRPLAHSKSPT